jgi:hypothetical protein
MSIDTEWENFISPDYEEETDISEEDTCINLYEPPKPGNIYISTKSKIAYLNKPIDLKSVFWKIPILPYATPIDGIIKKQMKFNSLLQDELNIIQENLKSQTYFEEQIITNIDNPTGRIKFKDIRKVSIGISRKDIMSYRCKKKSAFYNCFVMILRIKINGLFKEFHIKFFNTGKLEIPGIQTDFIFEEVLKNILITLQPHIESTLNYLQKSDTILINSNFNCGFYINRESLFDILKFKYNIQSIYDPCSYPGIQSKFYYNPELEDCNQTGVLLHQEDKNTRKLKQIVEVSFMIFRTGSILIVGMCNDNVLYIIYEFLKKLLHKEFHKINQKIITNENRIVKDKKRKIRKKIIHVSI